MRCTVGAIWTRNMFNINKQATAAWAEPQGSAHLVERVVRKQASKGRGSLTAVACWVY